jgi:hypothetical protein
MTVLNYSDINFIQLDCMYLQDVSGGNLSNMEVDSRDHYNWKINKNTCPILNGWEAVAFCILLMNVNIETITYFLTFNLSKLPFWMLYS